MVGKNVWGAFDWIDVFCNRNKRDNTFRIFKVLEKTSLYLYPGTVPNERTPHSTLGTRYSGDINAENDNKNHNM